MRDSQHADSGKEHLDDATAQIVSHKEIWVNRVKLRDEHLKHLLLILVDLNDRVTLVANLGLDVHGKWL